ncbi:MAG: DUF2177 family protein [Candidatus Magasanikbacteria bacterium]
MLWHFIKVYFSTGFVMVLIDVIWLGFFVDKYYHPKLEKVARQNTGKSFSPVWYASVLIYVVLTLGIVLLVLPRAYGLSVFDTFTIGAFYGLIVYGIYNLTNYSILKGISLNLVLIDIIWGSVLCGVVSMAATWFNNFFV